MQKESKVLISLLTSRRLQVTFDQFLGERQMKFPCYADSCSSVIRHPSQSERVAYVINDKQLESVANWTRILVISAKIMHLARIWSLPSKFPDF